MERLALEAQQQKQKAYDSTEPESDRPKSEKSTQNRPKKYNKSSSLNSSTEKEEKKAKKKGQKLYCICRTPYDKTK